MKLKFAALAVLALLILPAGSAFAAGAIMAGTVKLEGTAPTPEKIKMNADPFCAGAHKDGATSQTVVVGPDGTLKNVFIYVKEGLEGKTFDTPKNAVTFDQSTCMYSPHVFGVQAGQDIEIINSDSTLHNVHAVAEKNKGFNLGMPIKGMKVKKKFTEPEVMVKFKCDVHPWMNAYVGVLPHPFYAVTDENGRFKIEGLPAGTYTFEAWHEKYGTQTQKVTLGEGQSAEIYFTFKA